MMRMKTNFLVKIINTLLIIDIGIVLFTYLSGNRIWFINSQIGFISSSLVVFATFISYKKMVTKRVRSGANLDINKDTIKKIEDPYGVYENSEEKSIEDNKKDEKKRKISTIEALKSSTPTFSIYRIGAYLILIGGFLYLTKTHQLDIISYIFSISLPPIIIIIFLIIEAKSN